MFSRVSSEKEKSGEGDVEEAAVTREEVAGLTDGVIVAVVTAGAIADDEGLGPVLFGLVSFAEASEGSEHFCLALVSPLFTRREFLSLSLLIRNPDEAGVKADDGLAAAALHCEGRLLVIVPQLDELQE